MDSKHRTTLYYLIILENGAIAAVPRWEALLSVETVDLRDRAPRPFALCFDSASENRSSDSEKGEMRGKDVLLHQA